MSVDTLAARRDLLLSYRRLSRRQTHRVRRRKTRQSLRTLVRRVAAHADARMWGAEVLP